MRKRRSTTVTTLTLTTLRVLRPSPRLLPHSSSTPPLPPPRLLPTLVRLLDRASRSDPTATLSRRRAFLLRLELEPLPRAVELARCVSLRSFALTRADGFDYKSPRSLPLRTRVMRMRTTRRKKRRRSSLLRTLDSSAVLSRLSVDRPARPLPPHPRRLPLPSLEDQSCGCFGCASRVLSST